MADTRITAEPEVSAVVPATPALHGLNGAWSRFATARPAVAEFILFSGLSIAVTGLQLVIMPVSKWLFGMTALVDMDFRWLPVGGGADGQAHYVIDYAAGALPEGGGGLAYFVAVQLALALAQIVNFFLQRNITFKSKTNVWVAAAWYTVAYVVISFGAAALQGVYKMPVYELFITTWGLGAAGETLADSATMIINALISFCVFFPIFKIIFPKGDGRRR